MGVSIAYHTVGNRYLDRQAPRLWQYSQDLIVGSESAVEESYVSLPYTTPPPGGIEHPGAQASPGPWRLCQ